jgi:hypothetical protein
LIGKISIGFERICVNFMEFMKIIVNFRLLLVGVAAFGIFASSVDAVIVETGRDGDPSQPCNQVASAESDATRLAFQRRIPNSGDFPYWQHVGKVGLGSGVYLGDGYVLTSAHVGCYPFRMNDGSYYAPIYKSWTLLKCAEGRQADVAIFRVKYAASSSLGKMPNLPIASLTPEKEDALLLVGSGLSEITETSTLRSNGEVLAELGYRIGSERSMTWGFNSLSESPGQPLESGRFSTHCFLTRFDNAKLEAQAAAGDSGGASFAFNTRLRRWELAGCIIGVTQKDSDIPFGSRTYLANLSRYRSQFPLAEDELPTLQSVAAIDSEKESASVMSTAADEDRKRPELLVEMLFSVTSTLFFGDVFRSISN